MEDYDHGENNNDSLPKHFALQSKMNDKYLRYINNDKLMHGFLRYSGDHVVSPFSKFSIEDSKTNRGFVHIRCSYNNKYWVRWSAKSKYIVATANEPEEDQSKFSCTLFKPVYNQNHQSFRFKHVQLDSFIQPRSFAPFQFLDCLFADNSEEGVNYQDDSDLIKVIDWDSLFILPKHVAFKGDNGKYLRVHSSGTRYLEFSESDIGDPLVGNQVYTTSDGHVQIKNVETGRFWIRDWNWVHAKADGDQLHNPDTLFWPIRVGGDDKGGVRVALRNMGNNHFCKRLTLDGKSNCLNAAEATIVSEATMEIEELAMSRSIYDVNFRMLDARFYGETPIKMTSGELINKNSEPDKNKLKLRYEDSKSSCWNSSYGNKVGMKISIESGVPEVSSTEIEMKFDIKQEYSWGETIESKSRIEVEHEVVVPPSSRVTMKVMATKGFCDIPYSYTQRDVLTNGRVAVHHFDDGVFTASNCYNYTFLTEQFPL